MTDIPVVYVKWHDHFSSMTHGVSWLGMEEVTEVADFVEINTVGFLIKESDTAYKVALNIDENGNVNGNITILKATVKEIKYLKIPRR